MKKHKTLIVLVIFALLLCGCKVLRTLNHNANNASRVLIDVRTNAASIITEP